MTTYLPCPLCGATTPHGWQANNTETTTKPQETK